MITMRMKRMREMIMRKRHVNKEGEEEDVDRDDGDLNNPSFLLFLVWKHTFPLDPLLYLWKCVASVTFRTRVLILLFTAACQCSVGGRVGLIGDVSSLQTCLYHSISTLLTPLQLQWRFFSSRSYSIYFQSSLLSRSHYFFPVLFLFHLLPADQSPSNLSLGAHYPACLAHVAASIMGSCWARAEQVHFSVSLRRVVPFHQQWRDCVRCIAGGGWCRPQC